MPRKLASLSALWLLFALDAAARAQAPALDAAARADVHRLVAALLGDTPLEEDSRHLSDVIGGRPTGGEANLRSVEWTLERFHDAGVEARREAFPMPALWLERRATATVRGGGAGFTAEVAAMPFSTATPPEGVTAPLVDAGRGTGADFERLGEDARGAFALVATEELRDLAGLFQEYEDAVGIEERAYAAGVAGVVFMGSRSRDVLYRHNASRGTRNDRPMLVMARSDAERALRLLRAGTALELTAVVELEPGGAYESYNVVGEIRGGERPEEYVVLGAHLDSWGLGTGALDNGCNVALVMDVARQIRRLGLVPRRTIRFALFNGEEQGLHGSWGYVRDHAAELDGHVMASSYDMGSGRITGFYTGGRPQVLAAVEAVLEPVAGLGPFEHIDQPLVGTDNFDFMMQGVGNLVANQAPANYGPNYHAETDTFDQVDLTQLRLHAAIAAAGTSGFAMIDAPWGRQSRAELEELLRATDLEEQMRSFNVWLDWAEGRRGRQ